MITRVRSAWKYRSTAVYNWFDRVTWNLRHETSTTLNDFHLTPPPMRATYIVAMIVAFTVGMIVGIFLVLVATQ